MNKSNIKNDNYINIQGYMINELNLKNNELIVYAIINGFSQTDEQWFTGSLSYLAEWTNSTKRGVQKNLKSLLDKQLIEKQEYEENKVKKVRYRIKGGIEQSSWGYRTKFVGGIEQSSPNNIYNNIEYKENINISNDIFIKENEKNKNFVKPTIEEIQDYCNERKNNVDVNKFYDFYESKGWYVGKNKMKDWKASVRTWERNKSINNRETIRESNKNFFAKKRKEIEDEQK